MNRDENKFDIVGFRNARERLATSPSSPTIRPRFKDSGAMLSRFKNIDPKIARVARWCGAVTLIVASLIAGMMLRKWAFEYTTPIRFLGDITRGFEWGQRCVNDGYIELYDIAGHQPANSHFWLDYAPLRLAVMNFWARVNAVRYPGVTAYQNDYEFNKPVLLFNAGVEIFNAIGIFLLTRHWVRRSKPDAKSGGNLHGLAAAIFIWFNPAMILSGSCWPTWDLWVIPFYIWAMYFASKNWWFLAGVAIGAGAMFKGQQLFVAPIFILWPIFMGKPLTAMRWLSGFIFAIAIIASPWLLTIRPVGLSTRVIDSTAVVFVTGITISTAAIPLLLLQFPNVAKKFSVRKACAYFGAFGFGTSMLLCMPILNASTAWADCSWGFGTRHWETMVMGLTSNLPAIMQQRYGWESPKDVFFTLGTHDVSLKTFLFAVYAILLVISCVGIATHFKRNDRRFLIAIVTPWLLFFTIPAQIHERYLLYAAGAGATLIAVSVGMALLDIFLTLVTFMMTIHVMVQVGDRGKFGNDIFPNFGNYLRDWIRATHPNIGWAVIMVTLIFFYLTMAFPRRPAERADALEGAGIG